MKQITIVTFLMFVILTSFGQSNSLSKKNKDSLVRVKDWTSKVMVITDEVWNNIKGQIISQLGDVGYEEVRKNYDWKSIPSQMTIFDGNERKDIKQLNKKLDSLKIVYKIASFTHFPKGLEPRRYIILKVPYKGNEDWDRSAKWDTVYFILRAESLE